MSRDTLEAPPDDTREARDLSSTENADLCAGCVTCCTYVTIEVDSPRQAWEYDQWIWMLHHEGLELYVERPEKWFVYIATRCAQLNAEGRCSIHGRHPVLCRDYDPRSCERRYPHTDLRAWFKNAAEFEEWVSRERPRHWQRLLSYRNTMPDAPPRARGHRARPGPGAAQAQALVQIASVSSPRSRVRP